MEKNAAILMADLSGYTAMTDVHGGASAAKMISKYIELVNKSLSGQSKIVQRVGDQIVLVSDHPRDLGTTILKLIDFILEEDNFLSLHAGLHYGPIHYANDNLFGSTINVASRIMNLAASGQVLCSSKFVEEIESDLFSFSSIGKFKFKNVLHEVQIFELLRENVPSVPIDPVCHMHLSTPTKFSYEWSGTTFYFCSDHCRNIFATDPHAFVMVTE